MQVLLQASQVSVTRPAEAGTYVTTNQPIQPGKLQASVDGRW